MSQAICINCGSSFQRSPRHKNQTYCSKKACQRARKADWQRARMRTDPEYRAGQRLSQKKWVEKNPGYWKDYSAGKADQAERNRLLQRVRNQKRRKCSRYSSDDLGHLIAKMYASDSKKPSKCKVTGFLR